jgi:hypothetical protein
MKTVDVLGHEIERERSSPQLCESAVAVVG